MLFFIESTCKQQQHFNLYVKYHCLPLCRSKTSTHMHAHIYTHTHTCQGITGLQVGRQPGLGSKPRAHPGKGLPLGSLTWLSEEFTSLRCQTEGLSFHGCWLEATLKSSSQGSMATQQLYPSSEGGSRVARRKLQPHVTQPWKGPPVTVDILYWLQSSRGPVHAQGASGDTGHKHEQIGDTEVTLQFSPQKDS